MTEPARVGLIGQVLVDVMFFGGGRSPIIRLGGIIHAARTLWALDHPCTLGYVAPAYLDQEILIQARTLGAEAVKIGDVTRCPNVILVGEPAEAGTQGYEFLLRELQECRMVEGALENLQNPAGISDFVIFPGGFDLAAVLGVVGRLSAAVHIDANFQPQDPGQLAPLGRRFGTVIVSTSSDLFLKHHAGSVEHLRDSFLGKFCDRFLFKENRGGSRLFTTLEPNRPLHTPAQTRNIVHSVGVGDCFDIAYVVLRHRMDDRTALAYAAQIAAEYASTTNDDEFRNATRATLKIPPDEIVQIRGVSLPWEERTACHVYIAAPDFDYVDRQPIERVVDYLRYHNFQPRRPVQEFGQMPENASRVQKQDLCDADVRLMDECRVMVGVLLYNDPGTLIEIGMAVERGMPVIVYDPYDLAKNLMLTQLPNLVTSDLDEMMSAVFKFAAEGKRT